MFALQSAAEKQPGRTDSVQTEMPLSERPLGKHCVCQAAPDALLPEKAHERHRMGAIFPHRQSLVSLDPLLDAVGGAQPAPKKEEVF